MALRLSPAFRGSVPASAMLKSSKVGVEGVCNAFPKLSLVSSEKYSTRGKSCCFFYIKASLRAWIQKYSAFCLVVAAWELHKLTEGYSFV